MNQAPEIRDEAPASFVSSELVQAFANTFVPVASVMILYYAVSAMIMMRC